MFSKRNALSSGALSVFLALVLASLSLGCEKDESKSDRLVGTWIVQTLTIDANSIVPQQMEFEFESDGDFDLFFLAGNNQIRMSGEWQCTNNDTELDLEYEVNQVFFVGLVGFLQGADFPNEDYDIVFSDDNEIDLSGNINGAQVSINLERD